MNLRNYVKNKLPPVIYNSIKPIWWYFKNIKLSLLGFPISYGETAKAKIRRDRENFFNIFCIGKGLDIGYGGDLLSINCQGWDYIDGDAQYLKGLNDSTFDFVYSSHTLEHMVDPKIAL